MFLIFQELNGRPFEFGKLLDRSMSSSYTSRTPHQESLLREETQILKKREKEKDPSIQYLMQCNKLLLQKFPECTPDEDKTQE